MDNLPKGWCECKLSDLARTSSGGTPSRKKPHIMVEIFLGLNQESCKMGVYILLKNL